MDSTELNDSKHIFNFFFFQFIIFPRCVTEVRKYLKFATFFYED
jgi:hypothetical protein